MPDHGQIKIIIIIMHLNFGNMFHRTINVCRYTGYFKSICYNWTRWETKLKEISLTKEWMIINWDDSSENFPF